MTSDENALSPKAKTTLSIILLSIVCMVAVDIISDAKDGASLSHMGTELAVAIAALTGFGLVMRSSMQKSTSLRKTKEDLERAKAESDYWKQNSKTFVEGLNAAIDQQFSKWKFTNSEKEVALLMLKGLSSREIADIRGVVDKTIRAQATSIYEKSQLAGRAELSAFFLEDLLAPLDETKAKLNL